MFLNKKHPTRRKSFDTSIERERNPFHCNERKEEVNDYNDYDNHLSCLDSYYHMCSSTKKQQQKQQQQQQGQKNISRCSNPTSSNEPSSSIDVDGSDSQEVTNDRQDENQIERKKNENCGRGFKTIKSNVLTVGIYHSFAPVVSVNIEKDKLQTSDISTTLVTKSTTILSTISTSSTIEDYDLNPPPEAPSLQRIKTSSIYSPNLCSNIRGKDIDFIKKFASEVNISIEFRVMEPYDRIWEWAGGQMEGNVALREEVEKDLNLENIDICIAGLAPLPERQIGNAQWSLPYYYVQRSILIRRKDYLQNRLKVFEDFAHYQSSTISNKNFKNKNINNRRSQIGMTKGTSAQVDLNRRKDPNVDIIHIKNQEEAIKKLIITEEIDGYGSGLPCNQYLAQIWNDAIDRKFDEIQSQSHNSNNRIFQSTLENYIEEAASTMINEALQNLNFKDNEDKGEKIKESSEDILKKEEKFQQEKENYKLYIIDIHWMDPKEEFCAVINNESEGLLEHFNNYILSSRLTY